MATQVQNRRGSTAEHSTFTGAVGEVTVDTDKDVVVVHDGTTAGGYPQMRENGSNSALALGSAGTPSLKFTGDTNTGIYSPGADQVAISTNGTGRLFVDSSGRLLVGTSIANDYGDGGTAVAQFARAGSSQLQIGRHENGTGGPFIVGGKSRGATVADNVIVQTGDTILGIGANGATGTGYKPCGNIQFQIDSGTVSTTSMPGRIVFSTTADGAASPTERLRITSAGLVGIGTSSPEQLLEARGTGGIPASSGTTQNGMFRVSTPSVGLCLDVGVNGDSYSWIQSTNRTNLSVKNPLVINPTGGNVGIGTTSPLAKLHVEQSSVGDAAYFTYAGSTGGGAAIKVSNGFSSTNPVYSFWFDSTTGIGNPAATQVSVISNNTERLRIDASGRLLVGTSTARNNFFNATGNNAALQIEGINYNGASLSLVNNNTSATDAGNLIIAKSAGSGIGSNTLVANGEVLGGVQFLGNDGTEFITAASIGAFIDSTPGANDMPGRLVFSTTADGASSPTERLWITSNGAINMGANNNDPITNQVTGFSYGSDQILRISKSSTTCFGLARRTTDGSIMDFHKNATIVGSVSVTGTATAYNTSSDYRLKENISPVTDGITRLQQLKPSRFNFIADPDKTVDGFIAHEVQDVVPEAITGEKDAVDEEGNPIYQGIDQSKLVPLLTAALQEAVAKIESLEARLTAAGI